jgi:glycosyltransferase involved in cell wall biosynthesis
MPCFNSASTLGMALASIQAQSFQEWECIVVDDGSSDCPGAAIEAAADPRIRYVRLPENKGRAYARNRATSLARGEFISMLDADDWIFPSKLATQLEVLRSDASLALVSSYMGIVDAQERLVGVRGGAIRTGEPVIYKNFDKLAAPPMPFAPSMFRARDAGGIMFNHAYTFAEDSDYLLKLCLGRPYAVLSDIEYVYREWEGITLQKVTEAHRTLAKIFWGYRGQFPVRSCVCMGSSALKSWFYTLAHRMGRWDRMVFRRSAQPSAQDIARFEAALQAVEGEQARRVTGDAWPHQPYAV